MRKPPYRGHGSPCPFKKEEGLAQPPNQPAKNARSAAKNARSAAGMANA